MFYVNCLNGDWNWETSWSLTHQAVGFGSDILVASFSKQIHQLLENVYLWKNDKLWFVPDLNSMTSSLSYVGVEMWKKKPGGRFTRIEAFRSFPTVKTFILPCSVRTWTPSSPGWSRLRQLLPQTSYLTTWRKLRNSSTNMLLSRRRLDGKSGNAAAVLTFGFQRITPPVFVPDTRKTTSGFKPWTSCWSLRMLLCLRPRCSSGSRSWTWAGTSSWRCGKAGEKFWFRPTFFIYSCETSNRQSPSSTTR